MKIIAIDNFARESVADILIAENVNPNYVEDIVKFLQNEFGGHYAPRYFTAVEDDHVLWRGMEDLV